LAADAEASHAAKGATERDRIMNYYKTAYLLSGQKLMAVGNKRLGSIEELTAHMKGLLDISYAKLQEFCHSMIDYGDTLDAQLEAWLIALGKTQELQQWRDQISK
jgi:hypothetical protein